MLWGLHAPRVLTLQQIVLGRAPARRTRRRGLRALMGDRQRAHLWAPKYPPSLRRNVRAEGLAPRGGCEGACGLLSGAAQRHTCSGIGEFSIALARGMFTDLIFPACDPQSVHPLFCAGGRYLPNAAVASTNDVLSNRGRGIAAAPSV